jgi:hypothetical protein
VPYLSVANNSIGMGPLPGGWIVNQLQSTRHNLLLIDWTNFIGRDLPQNNTCIGKITQRKIEGFPLNPKFHVLGLALKDSPAAHDRSHVSRHKGNVFYVNNSAFPVWNHEAVQHENVLTIDLHGSPQWFEILLGRIEIEEGVFKGYYGKLFPQDYTKLVIKNPPRECQEFERFINHAYYGTYFQYFDQSFRFHQAVDVEIVYGNDFEAYAGLIGRIHENVVDVKLSDHRIDQVVTPSTFERLLHDTYIDEKGILRKSPGWIELGDRYFYLTRTLLNHQLCALLDHLLEIPGPVQKLHLYCAPGVVIPAELKQHVTCTQDDLDLTSDEFEEGDQRDGMPVDLMIDVSGRSPDDLLYGNKVTQTPSHFLFNEEQSDVWKALLHGKHVLLKGHFSVELIDHLSTLLLPNPYLWHRHQKAFVTGRLTLCPEKPTPALSWIKSDNRIVGIARSPDNPISLVLNPHQDRKLSLDVIFSFSTHQPAVLIQGAPGIGKSCFIRELINDHSDEYKIYSEKRIVEWAMDKRFRGKISALVIDESTIRGTDWSIFEGLYANPPHVLIKNKVYFLQPHQRVIFLGNQTPTMPSLFRRVAKMTFGPMTRDSVIEKILRPVLAEQAESFYAARPNLSVRELHAQAIAEAAKRNLMHSRFSHSFGQFDLTASRMPIVQSIITCLNARHFRRTAMHDTARFGGQSGIWIEGPAGIGKTELIRATLSALGYSEGTDYWVFSASMDSKTMMLKLSEAFNRGLIVVIDELDTALNMEMIAEINSFLMGENLNYERPHAPGFTLMATGNGPGYAGRMALPASLKSRLHCHELGQYPEQEARYILYKQFQQSLSVRPDFAWTMEGHLKYHLAHPAHFTFRELCDWLVDGGNPNLPKCAPKPFVPQAPATAATQTHAYRSAAANMQTHQQPTLPSVNLPNFMN